ncbi:aminotransferase class I/II-fold pyridoxal phosphate-dependent enzyme [Sediminibacter sp. Hel_I_10]|uniref:aminotransferase class I/II-fold pyridoxal phosphate-dependent enzyme n=1 Tax=Sediminibacter sp. Hel_I_10 TaxID=1392490 RepID=UPI00047EB3D8|nr:aminotransferase class I/II-fold pyridoxal phosphate-dependent enzyme [Sediminibacter sp. Hel_I_10]
MAKIKPNNFLDSVNDIFTDAINQGVLHLYADGDSFSGRKIGINKRSLFHFGTTGYLGLEQDPRLKKAAIHAIEHYGTQFPLSKSYISNPLYQKLEERVSAIFNHPVVITKNSTLGHIGVIPSAVKDQDAIILDHQVHWSVQSAAKMLKSRSVPIDMIRHNDLNMLEDKIKSYSNSRKRIWYMADGIYSMYGDYAPIKALKTLSLKYPQLHLYFDDVHGMSWIGKNDAGYVMSELEELSENMLLFGTLSKTFGASGSVLVCSNKKMYREIKTFGGPLTFSAQLEPASVAAATASAEIHLTPEIYQLQEDLKKRIQYFKTVINQTDLPLIDHNDSPVFFIGTGMPQTGYSFVNRLMKEGYYTNLGLFPAVPVKNTGVRITISRHNQLEDIKGLVEAMAYHLPKALEETNSDLSRVRHAFRMGNAKPKETTASDALSIQIENSIENIDQDLWNTTIGGQGLHDWEGLRFLEQTFRNNPLKEHNWRFWYIVITDKKDHPVLATFLSASLWKDDMLANVTASKAVEAERVNDPYYMTSMVLSTGCLFTEGQHLYIDAQHDFHKEALHILLKNLEHIESNIKTEMSVLRDFPKDHFLEAFFHGQGFVKIRMPEACMVELKPNESLEDYCNQLSSRNRRHLRKDILAHTDLIQVDIVDHLSVNALQRVHELYDHVRNNNLGLNTFPYPIQLFKNMSEHKDWEFILIKSPKDDKIIGVMFCYRNVNQTYIPSLVGLDYEYLEIYGTYRQLLYQTIKRAKALECKQINFGITASFEKKKLGATVEEKFAFIQTSDNFALELLGILEGQ